MPLDKRLHYTTSPEKFSTAIDNYYQKFEEAAIEIEKKLRFRLGSPYPKDVILAKFSGRVYDEPTNNIMPSGEWELLTIASNSDKGNRYLGAAYWNPKQQHVVVAHRGSVFSLSKMIDSCGSILTDVCGIMKNQHVPQIDSAITFVQDIKSAVERANKRRNVFIQLSITGHSLGGWLAQISTLTVECLVCREDRKDSLCWRNDDTVGYHAHTVVFDSPGCGSMLNKIELQYTDNRYCGDCFGTLLDITIYLSTPNLVNTCSWHHQSAIIYQVFIDGTSDFTQPVSKTHAIEKIIKTFDELNSRAPSRVLNWPMVEEGLRRRIYKKCLAVLGKPTINEYEALLREASDVSVTREISKYKLTLVDALQCSFNTLSQRELMFLRNCKQLITNPILTKFDQATSSIGSESAFLRDLLNHSKIRNDDKTIHGPTEELWNLISVIKNIVHLFPNIIDNVNVAVKELGETVWFDMRDSSTAFVGRIHEIDTISDFHFGNKMSLLTPTDTYKFNQWKKRIVIISGIGGIGKSELAIKYAHEFQINHGANAIYINSQTDGTIRKSFINLLTRLNIRARDKNKTDDCIQEMAADIIQEMAADAYEHLKDKRVLFIFDSANCYNKIQNVIPSSRFSNFRVLITTRNRYLINRRDEFGLITLNPLPEDMAVELVKRGLAIKSDLQDNDIKELVSVLGCLPLALLHAVGAIESSNLTDNVGKCVENLQKSMPVKKWFFKDHSWNLICVIKSSVDNVRSESHGNLALTFLNIVSFLDSNNIPDSTFLQVVYDEINVKNNNADEADFLANAMLNEVLRSLEKYDIIRRENGKFHVHRIVQDIVKTEFSEIMEKEVLEQTLKLHVTYLLDLNSVVEYTPNIVSVWNEAYKYKEFVDEFIVNKCDDKSLYTSYFHLVVSGCSSNAVESIVNGITDKSKLKYLLHMKDKEKKTVLHCAASNGDEKKVKFLLINGSNANDKKIHGWTPLHLAARGGHIKCVSTLIDFKAKVDSKTGYGFTPLHLAARNGFLEVVKFLLDKGADVNVSDRKSITPLHFAVKNGHSDVVKVLLGNDKINVNVETNHNVAPLHFAVRNNKIELVELIISNGADINVANTDKFTPLHDAATSGRVEIVSLLLETGKADINAQTSRGNTPLHMAAEKGHVEVVNKLIAHGADRTIVNNMGEKYKLII